MEWQRFPHVRSVGQINTFRADIEAHEVTVRLNDEVAARFLSDPGDQTSAGFFLQSPQQGVALFSLLDLKVWQTK